MLQIVPIMPKFMPEFAYYAPTMPTAQYYGRPECKYLTLYRKSDSYVINDR